MIKKREASERGVVKTNHSNVKLSFSFGSYFDPSWMGFQTLRILNEYSLKPQNSLEDTRFKNIEIITFVLEGELEHKDSLGNHYILKPGEVQINSTFAGYEHSLYNPSQVSDARFIQFWLTSRFDPAKAHCDRASLNLTLNQLEMISLCEASNQELCHYAKVYYGNEIENLSKNLEKDKSYWLQVISGEAKINKAELAAGDGALIESEKKLSIKSPKGMSCILVEFRDQ